MEKKELTCICCPMGCALSVELEGSNVLSVSGNTCKRGDTYARDEVVRPVRMVTSIVRVKNGKLKMLPVKTKEPIDKSKIPECLEALKNIEVQAPIHIGDIILHNVTGSDIIATRNVDAI
ncbi:DUF1667 domain-containing protein [Brachyspira hyodysenteriae]|uniref:NAD(FAD)-dependent dehydrogenase n=2 Tax=Brachyspira hyodysenteriae TaxID=159 RepID=A0A3B6VCF1_BRAHW|nr:DUF1667 domain-containing protein [Brachyspira hyodysenteriae]ACN84417.1 conserved hypothetical protein [Brachyspira hyodysenteriae WA1]ANN63500.1 NAD(FAD)-dependent dehydrogenase [Brachyspira hyodysenteriae ATCC 27164]AUJ50147.1 NAD(FAD)-dependent dehydrogenase [Brachyspira hyodysenteriae]KLI18643.1 NAD(FAD)-dependent dehydrogenase [Brachyspira hyodysenteriae]KLI18927.1 NAD(FAD)-dependent dehydrogenase [Brachyspira hyodysenteriae]